MRVAGVLVTHVLAVPEMAQELLAAPAAAGLLGEQDQHVAEAPGGGRAGHAAAERERNRQRAVTGEHGQERAIVFGDTWSPDQHRTITPSRRSSYVIGRAASACAICSTVS